eukprot:CAMPEP_0185204744 /NCGR_PEP_ID=MMETSP1140-20130426/55418_1 /TAXON_ID=298111 /ORGANISM="Pavlova sp., Strain CCMP459" /LENGTH=56 /DNA_ID=CAMNT_0027772311 /DNA_START=90 /DNA_END=260 /DNA_ORIENTATION=+
MTWARGLLARSASKGLVDNAQGAELLHGVGKAHAVARQGSKALHDGIPPPRGDTQQ